MTTAPLSLDAWWQKYRACYDGRTWRDYRPLMAEVVQHVSQVPLLDIGCGYGFLVECARHLGIPAIGLEASGPGLDEARRRHPHADIREWQAGAPLPVADEEIGFAVLNEVVDHFTLDQNTSVFRDLRRALKPAGGLLVKSPSRFDYRQPDEGHVTWFSPSEFRAFVTAIGYEVTHQPYVPQPLFGSSRPAWALVRLITYFVKPEYWSSRIDTVALKTTCGMTPESARPPGRQG